MKFGLKENYIKKINYVFSQFTQIEEVKIYGSRAKGNYKKGSDIDLVITKGNVDFTLLLRINEELDNLLLPFQIDLNSISFIKNEELLQHIERVGLIFYSKNLAE